MKSVTGGIHLGKWLKALRLHHYCVPHSHERARPWAVHLTCSPNMGVGALLSVSTFDLTHLCLCTQQATSSKRVCVKTLPAHLHRLSLLTTLSFVFTAIKRLRSRAEVPCTFVFTGKPTHIDTRKVSYLRYASRLSRMHHEGRG